MINSLLKHHTGVPISYLLIDYILGQKSSYTWNPLSCHGNCGSEEHLVWRVSICLLNRLIRFGFLRLHMLQGSFEYAWVIFHFRRVHTCHKLWAEICEMRQIFKWDLIKFCEIFTKITLKLPKSSQKPLFICKKLVIKTTKSDLCLFLHKMCCKTVWKFCEIW